MSAVTSTAQPSTSGDHPIVAPGSVVRWQASDTETCSLGDATWPPIGDSCWYPIDLLSDEGSVVLGRVRGGVAELTTVEIGSYPYPTEQIAVDERMVHPPDDQLERIRRESERVAALWSQVGPTRFSLPLSAPLDPLPEGRSFGARRVLNGEARSPHTGVDLSAAPGTRVLAAGRGTVVLASELYFAGKAVIIDHGAQLFTMYFHLSEIAVAEGQQVERAQVIGAVGATGRATGPHLHFGVRWRNARIDPLLLLLDIVPIQ